ncbi:IS1380 family transposase [Pseudonocardia aurantiaca]|uniref:IS1380 family transposase n=1 Tax=Pseudonocardia aurantiaca TaxID=75290 RepID=A0ABW4FYZ9_9PSEU
MKHKDLRPWLSVIAGGESLVSHAGGVLLVETVRRTGLARQLTRRLGPWRLPRASHDPGKIVADLAVAVALGGDAACDVAVLRAQPGVFGPVASDPTVSRLITRLAGDAADVVAAISAARGAARERVWGIAGAPVQDGRVVIDLDATLVTAHSDKQDATRTWKKTYGFHPLLGFVDHGSASGGEPVAELLRPGKAGSNTAADHVVVLDAALAQLPAERRARDGAGRIPVLVRTDAAGATREFATHLHQQGVDFSVGASFAHLDVHTALAQLPAAAWTPAYQARKPRAAEHGVQIEPRDGAWVAEATGLTELHGWPPGTRLILRKERPHPGAQLRTTDADGLRITGFLTNTPRGGAGRQLADLELRHRRHARVEDRIRAAKDTGLRNLPFHDTNQNRIWVAIAALAHDLLAWCARLALPTTAAGYEPKRLRLRLLATAGRLVRSARRHILHIDPTWPWAETITTAHARLTALPVP